MREKKFASDEKKRTFAGIFHTFYVQLMYDARLSVVWVLFMLLSLVGHGKEWLKKKRMNVGHLLITEYENMIISFFPGCFSSSSSLTRPGSVDVAESRVNRFGLCVQSPRRCC
jgi:hypothetical protein